MAPILRRWLVSLLLAGCVVPGIAPANPLGAQVINGQASFASDGAMLTITNSPGAILHWQGFSIGAGEITRFIQQSASSSVLNRVVGQDPSQILGALQSNGRVFLINPNGILFGPGARVDVNGLVASTLNLSNDDFLAGRLNFAAGDRAAAISNQGTISTPAGGRIYLVAPDIQNSGLITSPQGTVVLAAGHRVSLVDSATPDIDFVVSAPADRAVNLGEIVAQSGNIGIHAALLNQRGTLDADSAVVDRSGRILLKASGDALLEAGSRTTARGAGTGGDIRILGERVGVTGDAKVDASGGSGGGTVLVGGDVHGGNAGVMNARRTYLGADASIRADAGETGNGGKVIVWSDEVTRAYGSISARGGSRSGDGGFVETSGKQYLDFHAKVDVSAAAGKGGTLLLDPAAITLVGGTGDGASDGTTTFQGGATPGTVNFGDPDVTSPGVSNIYQSELEGLAPGTNIVLEATDSINTTGTFSNLVTLPTNSSLTMRTRNASTDGTGTLGIDLTGSADSTNLEFRTQGTGTLTLQTGTGTSPQSANVAVGKLSTAGGAVTLSATGSVHLVNITTTPGSGNGGDVNLSSGSTLFVGTGGIDARGSGGSSGNVTLAAGGAMNADGFIFANQLKIGATGGITNSDLAAINTRVAALNARNSGSGSIRVANSGANLSLVDIGATGYGVRQDAVGGVVSIETANAETVTVLNQLLSANGDIALIAPGGIGVNAAINAGTGNITLASSAGNVEGSGTITGAGLIATAANGIGHVAPLQTIVGMFSASNFGANTDISIHNTGVLSLGPVQQAFPDSTGRIVIDNNGALTVAAGSAVSTATGSIGLVAHSPLTVNGIVVSGTGAISLEAGAAGSSNDKLTIAASGSVSTGGTVLLKAGDAITVTGFVAGATVTQQPFQNGGAPTPPPTLAQCTANPGLAGCSAVLPSLAACTANPTLSGCSAVLPSLASCIASPATAGCSAVLPTLATCTASPSTAGCSAVLPLLASCAATPSLAGCSAVLPTVSACSTNPTLPGCSGVLPTTLTTANQPVTQTINTTVALINTSTSKADVKDDKTAPDKKTTTVASLANGAKKDDAAPKLYCN